MKYKTVIDETKDPANKIEELNILQHLKIINFTGGLQNKFRLSTNNLSLFPDDLNSLILNKKKKNKKWSRTCPTN